MNQQLEAAAPTVEVRFSRSDIAAIMTGLMLAMFLSSLDQTIVATSLSTMAQDLNGWEVMSWVVSAYLVASTTTTPIYGRLSDLYGRRPILLLSIGLFVIASVLCALSQTMGQLIAARVLQGIGGGGLRSVSQAVVSDVIEPRERGRVQGYFSTMFAAASVLGPVLGGLFSEHLTWHWIFWINIPFGLLALVLTNRNLKRLPRPTRRPVIDWLGAFFILASSTPILIAVSRVEQAGGWATLGVILPIAIGVAALVALVLRERVAQEPMLPLRLFRNSIFSLASVLSVSTSMVMIAAIIIIPLQYQLVAGLSADEAGARLIPMTGGTVLGSFFAGQLITRFGRYRIFVRTGAWVMVAACIIIAAVGLGRSSSLDIAVTALFGLATGCHMSPVTVTIQNALDRGDAGIGLSCMMFFRLMGGAFGVALLSTVLVGGLTEAALAVPGHEVLGPDPGLALFHLDQHADALSPALRAALAESVRHAFARVFWVASAIAAVSLACALAIREIPLRGGH